MDRYKMLPSYHYVENEDGVINNPATDKVRTCTIYGNHGKNLIPFPYVGKAGTQNGVTITVDSDGVITLNGTATAGMYFGLLSPVNSSEITKPGKYTISGMPGAVSGISIQCYVDGSWGSKYNDYGNGATFTVTSSIKYVTLQINSGVVCDNVVIKPMLEEGETKTDFELWCGVGDKTKNLIPYPYASTTQTINGITFTDNGDGTITVNGTATSFAFIRLNTIYATNGKYYLSGCPSGGGDSTYFIYCDVYNEKTKVYRMYDYSVKGITADLNSYTFTNLRVYLWVSSGATVNNLTFRPFLAKADSATSYEPYGYKIPIKNKSDITNIYTQKQIMQGESMTFNEPFKLSKANQLSVETAVKPSAVKYTYYTY